MERLAGRYDLESEIARGHGRTLWRGRDTVLDRPVGVLLLDAGHPHADAVRQAARQASAVEHAGLLRVIDTSEDAGRVFVVTRWLAGAPLSDQLAIGPLPPDQAQRIVAEVADALAAAAAEGVHHLVLDPRDVLLTDHGVVVVGVGVRAALEGVTVEGDAEQVDAWRLGALLYAALTGRWPGHPCAGLPSAPVVGGQVARPRQVRAGVPADVDEIAWRALDPHAPAPLESPQAVADALATPAPPDLGSTTAEPPQMVWRWLGLLLVLALFSTGAVLIAWQVWQNTDRAEPVPPPAPSASPSPSPTGHAKPVAPRSAAAYDPSGDGEENDSQALLAIDGDLTTAWTTVTYASRDLGSLKPGVGLLLRLAEPVPVSGVELHLVGRGSDLKVLAARPATDPRGAPPAHPDPAHPLAGFTTVASAAGASDLVTFRFRAVTTDEVLLWLTALPPSGGGFQGGVVEATLYS